MTGFGKALDARPFASLSSGLLARKGQAKPAMRPQGFGGFGHMTMGHEDLGWNDMGYDQPAPGEEPAAPVEPVAYAPAETPVPPVLSQRRALEDEYDSEDEELTEAAEAAPILSVKPRHRQPLTFAEPEPVAVAAFEPEPEPAPLPVAEAPRAPITLPRVDRKPAKAEGGRKAAFTLRLDGERHLKLRLACAVGNQSAQQIVTAALDAFLAQLPDLDDLADRLPGRSTH